MQGANVQNQNQNQNNPYFESLNLPILSLIKNFLFNTDLISINSETENQTYKLIETSQAKFTDSDKEFNLTVTIENKQILVSLTLQNSDTLTDTEKVFCKQLIDTCEKIGICVYIDNEDSSFDFDNEFYPNLEQEDSDEIVEETSNETVEEAVFVETDTETVEENISEEENVVETVTEKQNQNPKPKIAFLKLPNKSAPIKMNLKTIETQIENAKSLPENSNNPTNEWKIILKKMKELNVPHDMSNRIRVQCTYYKKKYGDNYISYIRDYAKKQFELL